MKQFRQDDEDLPSRFRLGLLVGAPAVIEGWNGDPLVMSKELLKMAISSELSH